MGLDPGSWDHALSQRQALDCSATQASLYLCFFFFFLDLFIYDRHREAETQEEGEAGPCPESEVGLDPGTAGSCRGPKAGAKPLCHPGIPYSCFLYLEFIKLFEFMDL